VLKVGDMFYIIIEGRAVVTQSAGMRAVKELVTLSTGQYFGELALISNEPRKASVTALTELHCYTIDKFTFVSVLGTLKDAETESIGISILRKVKILEGLSEKQMATISRNLTVMEFQDGNVIIEQGEEGDRFYMIAKGEVAVSVNHAEVARLKMGSYFGEMSLMNDERRNATVTALGEATCYTLNRSDVS
jgi:CRP-like cAMP-binding protein